MSASLVGFIFRIRNYPVKVDIPTVSAEIEKLLTDERKVTKLLKNTPLEYILEDKEVDDGNNTRSVKSNFLKNFDTIEKFVQETVSFLNDPGDLSAVRELPDGSAILFCGDTTWGDEPDVYGYQFLNWISCLNIGYLFNLE